MLELIIPTLEDLWFREKLLADEETMSYNHAWGGTIPFPKEKWEDWYQYWIIDHENLRYYRYLKKENDYVGEISYHYDSEYDGYVTNVIIYSKYRGKGYGSKGLEMLCLAAKENAIPVLYDDIAIDNPAIDMFLKQGFYEVERTEEKIILRKELISEIIQDAGLDYDNCLVNLANSILKQFGARTSANTLTVADEYLAKDYKNVVVLLLDALGVSILEKHLDEAGFFRSHLKHKYSSVYPPTTVAATTSMLSGLYPNEHGWLGWDMYFPELDKNVMVFRNQEQRTEREGATPDIREEDKSIIWGKDSLKESSVVADFDAASKYIPYTNIMDKINEANDHTCAYASMPYIEPYPNTLEKILERIKELCDEPGQKFIYSYWEEPDSTMHKTGTISSETHKVVTSIEKMVEEFALELSDTLLFITADHGHIDSNNLCILDYPEVVNCLKRMPSIETRTLNLFVKEECMDQFPVIFKRNFGNKFLLLKREEALKENLFGVGKNRENLNELLGDYIALATSNTSIFNTHFDMQRMPGCHAGLTVEETCIPLIIVEGQVK